MHPERQCKASQREKERGDSAYNKFATYHGIDFYAFCTHPTDGAGQHSGRLGCSIVPAGGSYQR